MLVSMDGEPLQLLPSLHGADISPEVSSNLLPRVQPPGLRPNGGWLCRRIRTQHGTPGRGVKRVFGGGTWRL